MSDLRDFFQGASNSIASNVSAPVDGIAWLLRKAGVPVPPNPMGGSDWMAEKGLTQQPQNRTAGLLGEFAGMTAPMVAAAKAPQIAKGLLSLDDKAMDVGRVAIENHMVKNGLIQPATVWHGSPHKFNKFDSSKIGTGEGAQAYGHGLYLAESPDVAKSYSLMGDQNPTAQHYLRFWGGDKAKAEAAFLKDVRERAFGKYTEQIAKDGDIVASIRGKGQIYKVDLPDEHIAKMLDWDKPLSQQAPEVQAAIRAVSPKNRSGQSMVDLDATGQELMRTLGLGDGGASLLRQQGIPGIRYLDGGSRGAGTGTSNYVVFPGNEGLLKILERNGQGLLD